MPQDDEYAVLDPVDSKGFLWAIITGENFSLTQGTTLTSTPLALKHLI